MPYSRHNLYQNMYLLLVWNSNLTGTLYFTLQSWEGFPEQEQFPRRFPPTSSHQYHGPRSSHYSDFYCHRLAFPVLKVHTNEIIQSVYFWVWLLSHTIVCFRFIHTARCISSWIFFIPVKSIEWIDRSLSILLLKDTGVVSSFELFLFTSFCDDVQLFLLDV